MREGMYTFWIVQFLPHDYGEHAWKDLDCAHALFEDLPWEDNRGVRGNYYRSILAPLNKVLAANGSSCVRDRGSGTEGSRGDSRASASAIHHVQVPCRITHGRPGNRPSCIVN